MFNWFGNKEKKIAYKDWVWLSKAAKYEGLYSMLSLYPKEHVLFVAHFKQTILELEYVLKSTNIVFGRFPQLIDLSVTTALASDINAGVQFHKAPSTIVFVEHHPISHIERAALSTLHEKFPSAVFSFAIAIDEPLLMAFNGTRMAELLSKMGHNPKEMLEHNMITMAIQRAQEKISKSATNHPADSAQEWFDKNYKV